MNKQIITIGRQCGSGGHLLGQTLAKTLGIPFYDKEAIEALTLRENAKEPSCTSLLFNLATGIYDGYLLTKPKEGDAVDGQAQCIRALADQGPCVIVGRCADHILRDRADCLRVFVYGSMEDRVRRMADREHLTEDEARRQIENKDFLRARHYRLITGQLWGQEANYDLTLNTSALDLDQCVASILAACQ